MELNIPEAVRILQRTPIVLGHMVRGLPTEWIRANEGDQTWSCYDIVGHLIHGDLTDWVPRIRIILDSGESRAFEPFDRFAQFREPAQPIGKLLSRFQKLRTQNLATLKKLRLRPADLARKGVHPDLGIVTLRQLISTWAVHDFSHLSQVCRVLAKQYAGEVGPWKAYMSILNR